MEDDRSRTYDLGAALLVLRRRLPLIVALGLVGGLLGLGISLVQEDTYTSETTMLSRDQGIDDRIMRTPLLRLEQDDSLGTSTNVGLADLLEVRTATGGELGLTPTEVDDRISISSDPEASLILLEADGPTPEEAGELANTFAETFIALRREDDRKAARSALAGLTAELAAAEDDGAPRSELREIEDQIQQVEAYEALQTGNVEQVQSAEIPSSPSSPRTMLNTIAGGLAGLLIGIGTALTADRMRPRFRSRRDAEAALGAPILAEIPPEGSRGHEDGLRTLRTRLLHPAAGDRPRTVLIVAVDDDRAAGAIGAGLASASAAGGTSCAHLDADMSRGSVAGSEHDLAAVLAGRSRPAEGIERGAEGQPSRVQAGASGDPASLLAGPHLGELLEELHRNHELVVISARSPLHAPDAVPLVRVADAIVVVASSDKSVRTDAGALRERLEALGATPAGVALLGTSPAG